MLNILRQLQHPNIIDLLATYQQEESLALIFPLASGSLRDYMAGPQPSLTLDLVSGFLRQLCGLSDALDCIHNLAASADGFPASIGAHNDLKPENILCFPNISADQPKFDIWKISDFGLGFIKKQAAGSDMEVKGGTPRYEPPEYAHNKRASRQSDIWSFGCIVLELLIFLLSEGEDLTQPISQKVGAGSWSRHSPFYGMGNDGNVTLHPTAKACITGLRKCRPSEAWVLESLDLTELMLNTDPRERISARPLCLAFRDISTTQEARVRRLAIGKIWWRHLASLDVRDGGKQNAGHRLQWNTDSNAVAHPLISTLVKELDSCEWARAWTFQEWLFSYQQMPVLNSWIISLSHLARSTKVESPDLLVVTLLPEEIPLSTAVKDKIYENLLVRLLEQSAVVQKNKKRSTLNMLILRFSLSAIAPTVPWSTYSD